MIELHKPNVALANVTVPSSIHMVYKDKDMAEYYYVVGKDGINKLDYCKSIVEFHVRILANSSDLEV